MGLIDICMPSHSQNSLIMCSNKKINIFNTEAVKKFDIKEYIFIDDSYYSGKTEKDIEIIMAKSGVTLKHTYVFYDGNPFQSPKRTAIYRYWDKHTQPKEKEKGKGEC